MNTPFTLITEWSSLGLSYGLLKNIYYNMFYYQNITIFGIFYPKVTIRKN